jgi:hypothetical protein
VLSAAARRLHVAALHPSILSRMKPSTPFHKSGSSLGYKRPANLNPMSEAPIRTDWVPSYSREVASDPGTPTQFYADRRLSARALVRQLDLSLPPFIASSFSSFLHLQPQLQCFRLQSLRLLSFVILAFAFSPIKAIIRIHACPNSKDPHPLLRSQSCPSTMAVDSSSVRGHPFRTPLQPFRIGGRSGSRGTTTRVSPVS